MIIDEFEHKKTPEQNLLFAVFDRAVRDFLGETTFLLNEEKVSARNYLFSEEEEDSTPFSITQVAYHSGLEVSDLRARVMRVARGEVKLSRKKGHR